MSRLLVCVLAVALTAGCATEAPGQPVPTTADATSSQPTSSSPTDKAPPINSPELDLASYEHRVCDLLTLEQLAPFAIHQPGTPKDGQAGPSCTWNPSKSSQGARVDLDILSKSQGGWEGVYDRRGRFTFFEEAGEINGYPAVHRDVASNGTKGICATTVGVRQDLVFDVGVFVNGLDSPEYKKACSVSDRVASAVIDTLKKGGR
jgi:hypothetical protein